jgi:hypothetical protein
MEEVTVCTYNKVLTEADRKRALIVVNPQWILGQWLRPCQMYQLNIIITILISYRIIKLHIINLITSPSEVRNGHPHGYSLQLNI